MASIPTREQARSQMWARMPGENTICETHRSIWRAAQALPPHQREPLEELIITAYIMGKKMATRLEQYRDRREGY